MKDDTPAECVLSHSHACTQQEQDQHTSPYFPSTQAHTHQAQRMMAAILKNKYQGTICRMVYQSYTCEQSGCY